MNSCEPPPPPSDPLPFVHEVQIGAPPPCPECPAVICPNDSFPVIIRGVFPCPAYRFRGLELLPSPLMGPRPQPPVVRIRVGVFHGLCAQVLMPWAARVTLPGLPAGGYRLMMEEVWESWEDSTRIDSTFHASLPFAVAEQCSVVTGPGCYLWLWAHGSGGPGCDAYLGDGQAQVQLMFASNVPIAGLQGDLVCRPPGQLAIQDVEPVGPASGMRIAWTPTFEGARFVMLDVDGHPILPGSGMMIDPILRVTVQMDPAPIPPDVVTVGIRWGVVSDPEGRGVPPCPTFAVVPDARICTRGALCDFNRDGMTDVRDLVLMAHCIVGAGFCPDTSLARLDCNHDGRRSLDDLWCCARVVLHGGIPDSVPARPEPSVRVSLGAPVATAAGLDLPVRVSGADRIGGGRFVFDYPAERFDLTGVDLLGEAGSWLALHETDGARVMVGLLGIGPQGAEPPATVEFVLHLTPRPGQQAAGELRLTGLDFCGPDGAALLVEHAALEVPLGTMPGVALSRVQPNPFSGAARFTLTLPRAATVELAVHDLGGRRVATLFRGGLEAGVHEFSWNGRGDDGARLKDGVYFLRAAGPGGEASRKLVLLRGN